VRVKVLPMLDQSAWMVGDQPYGFCLLIMSVLRSIS
jgi:hypothetical protein